MFSMSMHFPASMGNKLDDSLVIEKLTEATAASLGNVSAIKLYSGNSEYKTISNTDTLLAKGLVQYFEFENPAKEPKYMIFTNKYQLSALVKNNETDAEALEVAKFFDGREQVTVEVSYK
ncbi:MAG TPA: hypothetical protein PLV58_10020 [Campylobacterales bacterium]|nr:hypothetical protein [Campylobacterales bacterium]